MSIEFKAFIYRLSNVFGMNIYLARDEENIYIELLNEAEGPMPELWEDLERGMWQTHYGFSTVWTYKQPWHKVTWERLKHAFKTFR